MKKAFHRKPIKRLTPPDCTPVIEHSAIDQIDDSWKKIVAKERAEIARLEAEKKLIGEESLHHNGMLIEKNKALEAERDEIKENYQRFHDYMKNEWAILEKERDELKAELELARSGQKITQMDLVNTRASRDELKSELAKYKNSNTAELGVSVDYFNKLRIHADRLAAALEQYSAGDLTPVATEALAEHARFKGEI